MNALFIVFWTAMIFASIAWYGFLLFYIGFKGGHELRAMTKEFRLRDEGRKDAEAEKGA